MQNDCNRMRAAVTDTTAGQNIVVAIVNVTRQCQKEKLAREMLRRVVRRVQRLLRLGLKNDHRLGSCRRRGRRDIDGRGAYWSRTPFNLIDLLYRVSVPVTIRQDTLDGRQALVERVELLRDILGTLHRRVQPSQQTGSLQILSYDCRSRSFVLQLHLHFSQSLLGFQLGRLCRCNLLTQLTTSNPAGTRIGVSVTTRVTRGLGFAVGSVAGRLMGAYGMT